MKLYDGGRAPNPRRVRVFLAEKGITVPTEQVDLGQLAQRSDAYTAINPMQRVPALVLDDGTVIAESIAICRYFEALQPDPPLFGRGALESALVEMWSRRVELHLFLPVATVFQHLHPAMKIMVDPQVAAWGEANKPRVTQFLQFLDGELKTRAYVAGASLYGCRHHGDDRGRFHARVETHRAGRPRPCAALACRGVGAPERCRLMSRRGDARSSARTLRQATPGEFDAHTSCAVPGRRRHAASRRHRRARR